MTFTRLLNNINEFILNPIIVLAFAIALLYFFWGVYQFISTEAAGKDRAKGQQKILYGILGMFIMFAAKGLIGLVLNTFGITPSSSYIQF